MKKFYLMFLLSFVLLFTLNHPVSFAADENYIKYDANGGFNAPATQYYSNEYGYLGTVRLSYEVPSRDGSVVGTYTVTLDANDGESSQTTVQVDQRKEYRFMNWNTARNGNGTSYPRGGEYLCRLGSVTLFAQWETVFEGNVMLPTPVREGYLFKGWGTSSSSTSGVTGLYTVNEDITLWAVWVPVAGTLGNLSWTLNDDGLLTISGSGNMNTVSTGSAWKQKMVREYMTSVIIENGITSIGNSAFSYCSNLTSITIPDSVTKIGDEAFYNCSNLSQIIIPESVTSIGSSVFLNCTGLQTAGPIGTDSNYQFGWTDAIPAGAFQNCSGLRKLIMPASVTSIGNSVFLNCTSLKTAGPIGTNSNYQFGWTDAVPANAFYNCSGLTGITLPDSMTSIGSDAFYGCSNLESVTVPDNVTSIGSRAFYNCINLKSIKIPDRVSTIGGSAFSGCSSLKTAGPIGTDSNYQFGWTESIPDNAFDGCGGLKSVTVPDSITSIGSNAFYECESLTSITFPDNLISIGGSAFYGCRLLKSVTIPESVVSIGGYAFGGATVSLEAVYISNLEKWCNIQFGSPAANPLFNAHNLYLNGILIEDLVIPDTVTSISNNVFAGGSCIKSVILPNGISSIGKNAFYECSCLTGIIIPDGVMSIGEYAFYNCSGLTVVNIPDDVTSIGDYAFYNCSNLTNVALGNSVSSIGNCAFRGCSGLTSVTVSDGVTSIGEHAFGECSNLAAVYISSIENWCSIHFSDYWSNPLYYANDLYLDGVLVQNLIIPDTVTAIADRAFVECSSLTSVAISENVTGIGVSCFYLCSNLTNVEIPSSISYIGSGAFSNCSNLTDIYYGGSLTGWSLISKGSNNASLSTAEIHCNLDYTTQSWNNLTWTLYDNGTLIITGDGPMDDYTIYDNEGWRKVSNIISNVTIENGVSSISDFAFYHCASITNIILPDSIKSIGYSAFSGCSGLTSITIPSGVESISNFSFSNCSGLTNITIPEGVLSIGDNSFKGSSGLTSITLPMSIRRIGQDAFSNCSNLTDVYYSGSIMGWGLITKSTGNTCLTSSEIHYLTDYMTYSWYNLNWTIYDSNSETLIISGEGPMPNFTNFSSSNKEEWHAVGNSIKNVIIEPGITSISYYAFSAFNNLTSVMIPDSVTSIGANAFYCCSKLAEIVIPDSVITIGYQAFCLSALTSIKIPDSVTSIGSYTFSGCGKLSRITIPVSVISIGYRAFYNCNKLTDVFYGGDTERWNAITIDSDNTPLMRANIHYKVCWIPDFILPDALKTIDEEAFAGGAFTCVKVSENTISIGSRAFSDCEQLTSIYIPSSFTEIDPQAFGEKKDLTIFGKSGSIAQSFAETKGFNFIRIP